MYGVIDAKGGTENVERMLRRFKRVAESAGILSELKKRRSYEKPSEKKRRKLKDALRRAKLERMPQRKRRRKEKREDRQDRFDY